MRTLASHHCGRVISRTLLLMSAEIFVDPRLDLKDLKLNTKIPDGRTTNKKKNKNRKQVTTTT